MSNVDEANENRRPLPKPILLTLEELQHIAAGAAEILTQGVLTKGENPGTLTGAWPPLPEKLPTF